MLASAVKYAGMEHISHWFLQCFLDALREHGGMLMLSILDADAEHI